MLSPWDDIYPCGLNFFPSRHIICLPAADKLSIEYVKLTLRDDFFQCIVKYLTKGDKYLPEGEKY
jgi:hypothetical protein